MKQMCKKENKRVLRLKSIKFRKVVINQSKADLEFSKTIYKKQNAAATDDIILIDGESVVKHE